MGSSGDGRHPVFVFVLQKPRTVAELVAVCGLNSTGQAYHHMKPLLAGIADMVDVGVDRIRTGRQKIRKTNLVRSKTMVV